MSAHPSTSKRLGAALAFNSIYTVLRCVCVCVCVCVGLYTTSIILVLFYREEESLVDVFIIEMLVVMVNSLKLAHKDSQSIG